MNKPLVTVITITYNLVAAGREKYICQTIESVHNQTYDNIEHIIIDGASDDGTLELLKEYETKGWIKVFSEKDEGIYYAMNKGIDKANGKYIAFLNSDDFWHDRRGVEESIKALEENNADYSYAACLYLFKERAYEVLNPMLEKVIVSMPFSHQTMLTKTETIRHLNKFDTKFKSSGDYDFILRLILIGAKGVEIPLTFSSYRLGGLSYVNQEQSISEVIKSYCKNYGEYGICNDEIGFNIFYKGIFPEKILNCILNNVHSDIKEKIQTLLNKCKKNDDHYKIDFPSNIEFKEYKTDIKLVKLPFLKIIDFNYKRRFRLFGFIPLWKIKDITTGYKHYLFEIFPVFETRLFENVKTIILFNFIKIKHQIVKPYIVGVKAKDVCNWEKLIYPSETFTMPEMKDISGQKNKYFEAYESRMPDFYVRSFKNGICHTNREEVYISSNEVVEEYTAQKGNPQIGKPCLDTSNIKHIRGKVAHLSLSRLENNYFHWLVECLGRLYLIKKAGIEPDYYIISNHTNFQKQYLELLGLKPEKIIPASSNQLIQADELVVATFINNWEYIDYRGYKHYQKQWLPYWIGNLYKEQVESKYESTETKKIYVTRQNARYRKIVNERELIDCLLPLGYEVLDLDNLSVPDQIVLFKNASSIVTVHGSSLTNLLFAPKNIRVLEIYPKYYHDSAFRILGKALGINNYFYVIGEFDAKQKDIHPQQEDVYINVKNIIDYIKQQETDKGEHNGFKIRAKNY